MGYTFTENFKMQISFAVSRSGTDPISLLILLFLLGRAHQKILRLCRFKLDRDEIWHECFSHKLTELDYRF